MTSSTKHPLFARVYARASESMDRGGMADYRRALLEGLAGTVVEVGAGNGRNFAHYPPEVTRVLAVEPEPHLRRLAEVAAREAEVRVDVVDGIADALPAEDGSFDAAVVSLVLCSVPDPRRALTEVRRVLRPGGQLRFLEHVRAETPGLRRVQTFLDATVWPHLVGGCHTSRDPAAVIRAAGFTVEDLTRFAFPESRVALPTSPHVIGRAVRGGESLADT